jgi:hypothetical protein
LAQTQQSEPSNSKWSTVLRPNVALIQQARAAGEDCKNLGIGADKRAAAPSKGGNGQMILLCELVLHSIFNFIFLGHLINTITDMARIFGSDCTPNGLRFQFTDRFKPVAKRQLDMLAAGNDPKDIDLDDCKPTKGSKGQTVLLLRVSSA